MINSIFLRNFQSHKKTKLEFDPGVNIITGPSDSGKSSVLRALKLIATNRPSGSDIRSVWGGKTLVKVETDDAIITRSKDKAEEYTLRHDDGEPIIFHAFGVNVPSEIADAVNMSDINFQFQLDGPFLLKETPGAVATHFNKVAGLDKIDMATANINSWVRSINSEVNHLTVDLKKNEEDIKQYDFIPKLEIQIEVLEDLEKRVKNKRSSLNNIDTLLQYIWEVKKDISNKEKMLPIGLLVNSILSDIELKKVEEQRYLTLKKLYQLIWDAEHTIEQYQKIIAIEQQVNNLITLIKDKNVLVNQFTALNNALLSLNDIIYQIKNMEANLSRQMKAFNDNMGNICPLCDQPIKKGHKHEV